MYIYSTNSNTTNDLPTLAINSLLFPPIITDYELFKMGYFSVVSNEPLDSRNTLKIHYFRDEISLVEKYRNEKERVVGKADVVKQGNIYGKWALVTYIGLDDIIEKYLTIKNYPINTAQWSLGKYSSAALV
ncbi:MAG: hypothetical protein HZA50_11405 [Planctomycetes bacterium]|nr:hypothetical protein [Planctomycetota bacterium]